MVREEEVQEMKANIQNMQTNLAVMKNESIHFKTKLDDIHIQITKLNEAIVGNGKPGISKKIYALEQTISFGKWIIGLIFGLLTFIGFDKFISLFK